MTAKFYKHWKKIALALTSVFWASCGDDSSSTAATTTPAESSSAIQSSSSVGPTSSSGAAPESSSATPTSSSDEKIACVETTFEKKYADWSYQTHGVKCEDGEEYELESICPEYGIDSKCSDIYIGKNGKVYSEEEFKEIYRMAKPEGESSSSAKIVEESSSSTGPEIVPLYGVEIPAENLDIN